MLLRHLLTHQNKGTQECLRRKSHLDIMKKWIFKTNFSRTTIIKEIGGHSPATFHADYFTPWMLPL